MVTTAVQRGRGRVLLLRVSSLLVLVVLVAVSLVAFAVSFRVVNDQEDHLLAERTGEVGALLANSFGSIESSLRVLGPIGASSNPDAVALFTQSAGPLLKGNTKTVGVAADDGSGFTVVAAVGDGTAVGGVLSGGRAALAARALALDKPQLVTDLFTEDSQTMLVMVLPVEGTRAVAYQESVIDPTRVAPSTSESAFRELQVVLYASPQVDPDRLVVTTEADLPLSGRVELLPFSVGADQWLLATGTNRPLAGSLAQNVPWLFLAGGLVTALLAAAIVKTLARRARDLEQANVDLRRSNDQLEQANIELGRSNDELEQFAYVASHDLSEPLRAISGPISLIARRYQGQLDDEADQFIGFAVDGCQRMQRMIDDLLIFSRVGRVERNFEPTDCNLVINTVLTALGPAIAETGAVIHVEHLPVVRAEAPQLSQVFQNLIANALKFVAADVTPEVAIAAEPAGAGWRFTITDNGIGIDPAHRERIFAMFKRLHSREDYPGTGIGLALVKKIVERHGGRIGVEDNPSGTGTQFWFTLPTGETR